MWKVILDSVMLKSGLTVQPVLCLKQKLYLLSRWMIVDSMTIVVRMLIGKVRVEGWKKDEW